MEAVEKLVESVGGRIEDFYFAFGPTGVYVIAGRRPIGRQPVSALEAWTPRRQLCMLIFTGTGLRKASVTGDVSWTYSQSSSKVSRGASASTRYRTSIPS